MEVTQKTHGCRRFPAYVLGCYLCLLRPTGELLHIKSLQYFFLIFKNCIEFSRSRNSKKLSEFKKIDMFMILLEF